MDLNLSSIEESFVVLPENGSVVIIDNDPKEALPILGVLSKNGISTTYYKGNNEKELPVIPKQLVRLVFLDLQLIETSDEHQIAKHVTAVLGKIISDENGPYILILWSKNFSKYGSVVKDEIKLVPHLVPVCILSFNKRDCLVEKTEPLIDQDDFVKRVLGRLEGRVSDDDKNVIKESIVNALADEFTTEYEAKPNAIEIIESNIKSELKSAGVFHLFVLWENLIKRSSVNSINGICGSIKMNDLWEQNMRDVILRMARAQVGQNEISPEIALKASLATLTYSFSEEIDLKIREYQFPNYIDIDHSLIFSFQNAGDFYGLQEYVDNGELKCRVVKNGEKLVNTVKKTALQNLPESFSEPDKTVVREMTDIYLGIPFHINTRLHIEANPSNELAPGNIYFIDMSIEKKTRYSSTYFDTIGERDIDLLVFIELEVSPICDYAQTKWKKSRVISGILYPPNLKVKSQGDNLFRIKPIFIINGKRFKIVFDFHLFKSLELAIVRARHVQFRLKRELLLDVIANLSGHVNRPGIAFVP